MKDFYMRLSLFTLFFTLILPISVMAQNEPEPPAALAKMQATGSQIFYLGEFENMYGWALIRQGKPEFFYENKERTAMVMGLMFNDAGEMITMAQLKNLNDRVGDDMYASTGGALSSFKKNSSDETPSAVATDMVTKTPQINRPLTKAEIMYTDLLSANWVTINPEGAYDIFAFIDPDCPHCKTFINDTSAYQVKDGVRIRAIPIGINEQSMRKSAVLLSSANPAEKLKQYAAGDDTILSAPANINTTAAEKNMSLMIKHGFDVTPIIIYKTGKGEIRMIRGRPADMNTVINDIVNN